MSEFHRPEDCHLQVLHQLLTAATAEASTAMCRWTNGLITLSLDEVRELPLESVCSTLGIGDEQLTMVVLSLPGETGGEMILTFDEINGRQLAGALLNRPAQTEGPWTELEQSALCETGNILGCAYLNALQRLVTCELVPSPPYFIQDFGASVLEQALMMQALDSDKALVCRTCFHRGSDDLNWNVFFLPTAALRRHMEEALFAGR